MKSRNAVAAFAALAQETRLAAFRALVEAGPSGLAAGALAAKCGASGPVMSFHLKELTNAGLVRSRKDGRSVIYAAAYEGVRELIDFLMKDCCRGDPRCCGDYAAACAPSDARASNMKGADA